MHQWLFSEVAVLEAENMFREMLRERALIVLDKGKTSTDRSLELTELEGSSSGWLGLEQTTHLIQYLTNSKPCNIGLPPLVCFWLRYPASSCMVCFAALQLSMALERAVALWKSQRYESYGPKLGIISAFFSVVVSFATVAWVVRDADIAPRGFYCSSVTGKTAHRITLLSYLLCAINMITLIAIIFLNIFNKFAMTWFTKSFSLQSYQLCENASAIRVMLPLNVFQIMSYLLFSIGAAAIVIMRSQLSVITFQTLITSVYVIPFYTLISPILIWFVIRWSKQMKAMKLQNLKQKMEEEREIHFLELGRIWNGVTVNK
ncbi:integral membrane protein [Cooperia oncophora]